MSLPKICRPTWRCPRLLMFFPWTVRFPLEWISSKNKVFMQKSVSIDRSIERETERARATERGVGWVTGVIHFFPSLRIYVPPFYPQTLYSQNIYNKLRILGIFFSKTCIMLPVLIGLRIKSTKHSLSWMNLS